MNLLHTRDPLDRILIIAIAVSLLVHLVIYAGSSGLFSRKKTIIFAPYRVKLVGGLNTPRAAGGGKKSVKGGKKVKKATVKKVKPAKKSVKIPPKTVRKSSRVKKKAAKKVALSSKKSTRKKKQVKKEERNDSDLAELGDIINQIKKRESRKRKESVGTGGGNGGTGNGEVLGGKALSVLQRLYFSELADKIRDAWILPPQLKNEKRNLMVVLAITISADGRILKVVVEKPSGNAFFDESAVRAVKKLGQLTPPPIKGDKITIGLRFFLRELQR